MKTERRVRYVPPRPEVIDHFAREACRALGEDYRAHEVVEGFAGFMQVVARVLANDLNRKHPSEFDTGIE